MAKQYKLKVDSLDMKIMEKREVEVEGIEGAKVLLVKVDDEVHVLSSKCTHYGAPLVKGVVTPDGRLTCPWHGGILFPLAKSVDNWLGLIRSVPVACFLVNTGDVEDSPALDPLGKFPVITKDGSIYITGEEAQIKGSRGPGDVKCAVQGDEKVVIVGGYVLMPTQRDVWEC